MPWEKYATSVVEFLEIIGIIDDFDDLDTLEKDIAALQYALRDPVGGQPCAFAQLRG